MSAYDFYKRTMGNFKIENGADMMTIGQQYKSQSDMVMEQTWWNDPQSKVCYIYDYFHDDQPDKKDHMTYENTTKTRIDAKFIIKTYQSVDKEQVDYYIQFRPSQKVEFEEGDDLYYFETDYRNKTNCTFPMGLYLDVPDDRGVYHKWMVVYPEPANQFPKYLILPINYQLMWIERNGHEKIKRKMWGILRGQSSYNSGIYTDYTFTKMENQEKGWLPFNKISEKLWYQTESGNDTRVLLGSLSEHPLAWLLSKVENMQPFGIQRLTFYQDRFNPNTDYVNLETKEMYADYYDSKVEPITPTVPDTSTSAYIVELIASSPTIKIGGSYKQLTVNVHDLDHTDLTNNYLLAHFEWQAFLDSEEITSDVIWLSQPSFNQIKVKIPSDPKFRNKILTITCNINNGGEILTTKADFELKLN